MRSSGLGSFLMVDEYTVRVCYICCPLNSELFFADLNRSQPPLFIQMLSLYVNATKDTSILQRALPLAEVIGFPYVTFRELIRFVYRPSSSGGLQTGP
jgi:hypothetical protein